MSREVEIGRFEPKGTGVRLTSGARWAAMSIAVGMLACACSEGAKTAKPSAAPSATTTQDGIDATRRAVLDGYKGMWNNLTADLASRDWQHPTVTAFATGNALLILEADIRSDNNDGVVTKGTPLLYPVARFAAGQTPSTAEVIDCADFSQVWKYRVATHSPLEKSPGGWHLIDASMVLKGARWKVTELAMGTAGSC